MDCALVKNVRVVLELDTVWHAEMAVVLLGMPCTLTTRSALSDSCADTSASDTTARRDVKFSAQQASLYRQRAKTPGQIVPLHSIQWIAFHDEQKQ
jgi:hypothetical protein